MIHFLWSILVGFFIGLIARAIMPGDQHMGFIGTTILGIVGSLVGGLLARGFNRPSDNSYFHPAGFFMSIVGALVTLIIIHFI